MAKIDVEAFRKAFEEGGNEAVKALAKSKAGKAAQLTKAQMRALKGGAIGISCQSALGMYTYCVSSCNQRDYEATVSLVNSTCGFKYEA